MNDSVNYVISLKFLFGSVFPCPITMSSENFWFKIELGHNEGLLLQKALRALCHATFSDMEYTEEMFQAEKIDNRGSFVGVHVSQFSSCCHNSWSVDSDSELLDLSRHQPPLIREPSRYNRWGCWFHMLVWTGYQPQGHPVFGDPRWVSFKDWENEATF